MGFAPLNIKFLISIPPLRPTGTVAPRGEELRTLPLKNNICAILKNCDSNIKKQCGSTPLAPCPRARWL